MLFKAAGFLQTQQFLPLTHIKDSHHQTRRTLLVDVLNPDRKKKNQLSANRMQGAASVH